VRRIGEALAALTDKNAENDAPPLWRHSPDGDIEFYYPPNTVVRRITRQELEAG
jgi:hypothetical protein